MSNYCLHNSREWVRLERGLGIRAAHSFASMLYFLSARRQPSAQLSADRKKLLIVRTDRIGDYLLFRNFLPIIRTSAAYRAWQITFCGNRVYRDLAETYDRQWVDHFIWIDRERFSRSAFYHFGLLQRIAHCRFDVAFQPAFSRDVIADLLVLASQAPVRICVDGDAAAQKAAYLAKTHAFYHRHIKVDPQPKFEFYRNREIIEQFLGEPASVVKPNLTPPPKATRRSIPYAVLAGGAASRYKQWPFFGSIAVYLRRYGLTVYLTGLGGREHRRLKRSMTKTERRAVVDLCGKTSLVELADLLAGAALVVANDTGTMHMAAMLGRPTICVSGGTNAVRFNLYPLEFGMNLRVVFPPAVEAMPPDQLALRFVEYADNYELAQISVARVCEAIDELFNKSAS